MRNPAAILRLPHELLIDMIGREIAGDAGEQIDIALRHGLAEGDALSDRSVKSGRHCQALSNSRAMMVRWIWLVPS